MNNKIKPVSPDDIMQQKIRDLPDEVIDAWNRILVRHWCGGSMTIRQETVVEELMPLSNFNRGAIFSNGWLDVEELYRANGWNVEYDRPGYNESYDAFWVFTKRSRG